MTRKKELNIIGIIPARGGSKRLPLKNIRYLAGKPLIAYMIMAARRSKYLRRVLVSTDHPEIKKIALQYGAEVPFKRPRVISGNCSTVLVTQHAVRFIEREEGKNADIIVTLQPTTPFCNTADINACIDLLLKNKSILSVFSGAKIHERPEWMFKVLSKNLVRPYLGGAVKGKRCITQQLNPLIIPNGGIYVTRREALFQEGVIISKRTLFYEMPRERSVDIDEEIDFEFAEFLTKKNYRQSKKSGMVIWLTGISGSGKTTLGLRLKKEMEKKYGYVEFLDGDTVRNFFENDLGYSRQERIMNVKRIAFAAKLVAKNGTHVIVANIAPYYKVRDFIRKHIKNYIQVYLKASLDDVMRRDKKGQYNKCLRGKMNNFIGWDEEYDLPRNPNLVVETGRLDIAGSVEKILNYLNRRRVQIK